MTDERNLRDELGAMPELDEPLDFIKITDDKKGSKSPEEIEREIFTLALEKLVENEEAGAHFLVPMADQTRRAAIYKSSLIAKAGILGASVPGEVGGQKTYMALYTFTTPTHAKRWLEVAEKYKVNS